MTTNRSQHVLDEDPPWLDPREANNLRDDADDFEDALIAEQKKMSRVHTRSHG